MGRGSSNTLSCGSGRRHTSDPVLLWLWCRPAAESPIQPLAWEILYATSVALKRKGKQNKTKKNFKKQLLTFPQLLAAFIFKMDRFFSYSPATHVFYDCCDHMKTMPS